MQLFYKKRTRLPVFIGIFTACFIIGYICFLPAVMPDRNEDGIHPITEGDKLDEYSISLSISGPLETQYTWLKKAHSFFIDRHFNAHVWIYNGRKALEIINLSNNLAKSIRPFKPDNASPGLRKYFFNLLEINGLKDNRLVLTVRENKNVPFLYDMSLESNEKVSLFDRETWEIEVGELLIKNGYSVSHLYEKSFEHMVSISYPPWNDAEKILKLISSSLTPAKSYRLYEDDMMSENPYFLHDIIKSKNGFTIEIFKPGKWQLGTEFIGDFEIIVTNSVGKKFSCVFRQPVERELRKTFPEDFFPDTEPFIDEKYQIRAFLDGERIMNAVLTKSGQEITVNRQAETPVYFSDDEFRVFPWTKLKTHYQ